jgi:DNA-nicking Smr family endonuclease
LSKKPPPRDDDEQNPWDQYVKDIKPLYGRKRAESVSKPKEPLVIKWGGATQEGNSFEPSKNYPDLVMGRVEGVQLQAVRSLTQGHIPTDARLDLHGYTQTEAELAFTKFIKQSAYEGMKCVLVITGRGSRSASGQGVLRGALPSWVNEPQNRPFILYYNYAKSYHGGEGAFYFLLRTKR